MSPTTEAKAAAIRAALPHRRSIDLAALLAMLTSANKEEREQAKREVRSLTTHGGYVLGAQANADRLREFANRAEPGEIAP